MFKVVLPLLVALLLIPQKLPTPSQQPAAPKTPCQSFSAHREGAVITGNVAVRRSSSNGNIVVIVDRSGVKASPDGIPDLVYRFAPLRQDTYRYNDISFNLKQAQVFSQPGRLAVVSNDNHLVVSLSVEEVAKDDSRFSIYGDQSRDLPNTVRLSQGIGLVRQVPKISDDLLQTADSRPSKVSKLATFIDLESDFVIRKGGTHTLEEASCTSGGQGATSCSIDCPGAHGCSVSCGSGAGYWACCNCPDNCKCTEKGLID